MARGIACGSFVLVSYTFIAAICSLSFFSLGIFAKITLSPYFNIGTSISDLYYTSSLSSLIWILLLLSGITTLMAFACSCCCLRSKGCGIFCVALVVTIALIGQQVAIQKCYSHQNEVLQQVESNLNVSLPQYTNTNAVEKFWNKLQKEKQCCGFKGPEDWTNQFNNNTLPSSCCTKVKDNEDFICSTEEPNVFESGCDLIVMQTLQESFTAIRAITFFIFALELLTIIMGLCACCCLGPSRIVFDSKIIQM